MKPIAALLSVEVSFLNKVDSKSQPYLKKTRVMFIVYDANIA